MNGPPDYRRELDAWDDVVAELERQESYMPAVVLVQAAFRLAAYRQHAPLQWRGDFTRLAERLESAAREWTAAPGVFEEPGLADDDWTEDVSAAEWSRCTGRGW